MTIGVLKEPVPETRVSLLPEHVSVLKKWKIDVVIESGAGATAFANDEKYIEAGASTGTREEVISASQILLSINETGLADKESLKNKIILGVYQPLFNYNRMQDLSADGLTVFSIDMIP